MRNYSLDQILLLELLAFKEDVSLLVAPSFVVDFDYKTFVPLMKGIGFDHVFEITFGAKVVTQSYQKYIVENKDQEKFISSTCPMCVNLISARFPSEKKFLLPFDSPMIAMAKIVKKNFPKEKIVFLSPCTAKKFEAKDSGLIDCVITFKELKQLIENVNPKPIECSHLFDKFYNDFTKIYPLSGGLSKTMNVKKIFAQNQTISIEGQKSIVKLFESNPKQKFFDILYCNGGCIGGNGINIKTPTFFKKHSVKSYIKNAKKEKIGERMGLNKYTKGINFSKKF
ncbi:MAG: [Fe-Fe] hydrogenase large subunit C-terminal domain-containing protein [Candidatus ainarchaeum sp.]|nr:[Fe-Fe] hydrogenase large subunit C-terminal domain-containing protein [Candidatus ainarchaeum sp.]